MDILHASSEYIHCYPLVDMRTTILQASATLAQRVANPFVTTFTIGHFQSTALLLV